jgi:hypothetical protein
MGMDVTEMNSAHSGTGAEYEIKVEGELDESWEAWFSSMIVALEKSTDCPTTTTLTGALADQAALRGMLCRIWDLNLTIVSVRRIDEEEASV